MKKFFSLMTAALVAVSAMAETEYLQSATQGAKGEASVATSFTIAGAFNPGPGSSQLTLGDYTAKAAKFRTNQEGNTLKLDVNEGMELTGINAICTSNYAGTNVIITSILADGVEVLTSNVTATHVNNGDPTTFAVSGFSAKESVVFKFTNENISDEGKGTQINILAEVTYQAAGAEEEPNANDAAMEQFFMEYESLSQQFTMVYNVIAAGENEAIVEEYLTVMNGIYQNMSILQIWASESYEAGTLANDLDEILSQFEGIQIQLTQCLNSYNEALNTVGIRAIAAGQDAKAFDLQGRRANNANGIVIMNGKKAIAK